MRRRAKAHAAIETNTDIGVVSGETVLPALVPEMVFVAERLDFVTVTALLTSTAVDLAVPVAE